MQPALLIVFHEMGQETRRGASTRRIGRTAGIIQLGKVRRQLATVELCQRQTPERLVFLRRACQQTGSQLIVKAKQRMVIVAQRSFRRAGQRGGINDQFWFLRAGVDQAIGQYQSSFGIGIHYFNFFTVAIVNDIAEFKGVAADQVIRTAQIQLHALVQTTGDGERQRAGHRCRAAHIRLHRVHKCALLDAVTAGVKSNSLTHQAGINRGFFIASWIVIQRQQYRRTFGATTYGMQSHVVLLAQIFAFSDAVRDVIAGNRAQQVYCALRQLFRAQLFCRSVNGIAHPVNNFQAVIQLFALRLIQSGPLNFAGAFWSFVALPERPATFSIPAFTIQLDMFNTQAVNFTGGALDKAEVIFSVQVQGNAIIINAVCRLFTPAGISGLRGKRNFHGFCHFIYPYFRAYRKTGHPWAAR